MIRVENLYKSFGDRQILKGIDIEVNTGETVAILGPSGSGKSTTLRCINQLEKADSGYLTIGENRYDLSKLTKDDLRQIHSSTAMVFQNFSLFENKTALNNIMLPLIKAKKYSKQEAYKTAISYLEKVGLLPWKDHYPAQLSGGQAQRVGIARALALKPSVILFDEPTSALDPEMVQGVLQIIKEISNERITSIIVTHELEFAKDVADHVVFMEDGVVLEKGKTEDVFKSPKNPRTLRFLGNFADRPEYII